MIMLTDAPLLFTPGQVNCLLWLTFCSNFRVLSFLEHLLTLNILVDVFSWHWQRCTSQITCMEFLILRGHCPYAHYLSLSLSLFTFLTFSLSSLWHPPLSLHLSHVLSLCFSFSSFCSFSLLLTLLYVISLSVFFHSLSFHSSPLQLVSFTLLFFY